MTLARLSVLLVVALSAAAESLEDRVSAAVARGSAFLLSRYEEEKGWGGALGTGVYGGVGVPYPYAAGPTALACFALLKADVPPDHPVLKKAFSFLRIKHRVPGVSYEQSVMILAVAEASGARKSPDYRRAPWRPERSVDRFRPPKGSPIPKERWTWICDLVKQLLSFQASNGGWRYYPNDFHSGGRADTSATQFALLALATASRIGYDVPEETFRKARGFLLRSQRPEGRQVPRAIHVPGDVPGTTDRARGFPYIAGSDVPAYDQVTGGMTAAGVASLILVRDELAPDGSDRDLEQAILDGFAWLGRYLTIPVNPGAAPFMGGSYGFLWLYALERCGDLMGRELIGRRSWFAEGAAHFLPLQREDGAFVDPTCMNPQDVLGTSFALLFLTRATRPVSGGE